MPEFIDLVEEIVEPEKSSNITRRKLEKRNEINRSTSLSGRSSEQSGETAESQQDDAFGPISVEDATQRQQKIKQLLKKFQQVDDKIDFLSEQIQKQTSKFDYSVDISNMPQVKKAVRKIFKKNLNYIDKNMYLEAVKRLQQSQEESITKEFSKLE